MKKLTAFLFVAFASMIFGQTTLVVTSGAATLDGVISNGEYTSTPLVTQNNVTLYAMDDGYYFYLAAPWADTTQNIAKKQWFYDGSSWSQSGDEDRIAFIFDMGLNDPDGPNCTTMCHGDGLMWTNHGKVDVWHWKAHRGNPMGFADDKYFNEVLGGDGGRHGDDGTSTYSDNGPDANSLPEFMASGDPGANVDFLIESQSLADFDPFGVLPGTSGEAVTFDGGAAFTNGNVIPGYVLRKAEGDRGDVVAAGKWNNGVWTVEFRRKNSGSANDFSVPSGGSVDFVHEIFDNTGGGHPNDGFDPTVYTLDFSGITAVGDDVSKLPESFMLNQNYPNPFNPSTSISYSIPQESFVTLKVYDILGNEVQTIVSEKQPAGNYDVSFDATDLPSGVYLYTLDAGSFVMTKKMILLK